MDLGSIIKTKTAHLLIKDLKSGKWISRKDIPFLANPRMASKMMKNDFHIVAGLRKHHGNKKCILINQIFNKN